MSDGKDTNITPLAKPILLLILAAMMLVLGKFAPEPHGVPYYVLTCSLSAYALWLLWLLWCKQK